MDPHTTYFKMRKGEKLKMSELNNMKRHPPRSIKSVGSESD